MAYVDVVAFICLMIVWVAFVFRARRGDIKLGRTGDEPPALRVGRVLRIYAINFWLVTSLFMWFAPYKLYFRLLIIAFISLFCGGGLIGLQHKLKQFIREHRLASGCCVHCGYDLRATPDRCPECGTVRSPLRVGTKKST